MNPTHPSALRLKELRARGVTHVYLCGLATDVCVTFSALHAAEEGFVTTVVVDACAGVAEASINEKINIMSSAGVQIVQSKELELLLQRSTLHEAVRTE